VDRHNAGDGAPERKDRGHNYDGVRALVIERVRMSAGADLGQEAAAGCAGGGICGVGAELPAPGR
jgi:hypothetical protein